jgi:hypothetical protein
MVVGSVDASARWALWSDLQLIRQNRSSNYVWYEPD